jgi:hypothetical protein
VSFPDGIEFTPVVFEGGKTTVVVKCSLCRALMLTTDQDSHRSWHEAAWRELQSRTDPRLHDPAAYYGRY